MLNSGIPPNNAVDNLRAADGDTKLEGKSEVSKGLKEGNQLSKSRSSKTASFLTLIRMVSEKTGKLDDILERMSEHYNKGAQDQSQIRELWIYPVLAFLAVAATLVLLYVVIPTLSGIFEQSGSTLSPTRTSWQLVTSVQSYWYILFEGVGLLVFLFLRYRSTEAGRYQLDQLAQDASRQRTDAEDCHCSFCCATFGYSTSAGIPLW